MSNGELYTIITNKDAKGNKGAIVGIFFGTKVAPIIEQLLKIPSSKRNQVKEITLDMANSMKLIVSKCFPKAIQVTDRFHVQKLAIQALQDIRIKYRWKAIDYVNNQIKLSKTKELVYNDKEYINGDSTRQLLSRSRFLLYKSPNNWTRTQKERAHILFKEYPDIKKAYDLVQGLRNIYNHDYQIQVAYTKLAQWFRMVEESGFKSFNIVVNSISSNYKSILNYFVNRSTNVSAESFNAKIKAFRAQFRGVRNIKYFLYRLTRIFA